jgi:hypothetical protein
MATLLAPADVRGHIETDLLDPAIQRLLDDADAEIIRRFGAHVGNVSETIDGRAQLLAVSRPVQAVVSVTERIGVTDTLLDATDWQLWYGKVLERRTDGTHGGTGWGDRITIVYTPVADTSQRARVELDLVKLAIQYSALRTQSSGDYAETAPDYEDERETILSVLAPVMVA